jgi:hypothetical protein
MSVHNRGLAEHTTQPSSTQVYYQDTLWLYFRARHCVSRSHFDVIKKVLDMPRPWEAKC